MKTNIYTGSSPLTRAFEKTIINNGRLTLDNLKSNNIEGYKLLIQKESVNEIRRLKQYFDDYELPNPQNQSQDPRGIDDLATLNQFKVKPYVQMIDNINIIRDFNLDAWMEDVVKPEFQKEFSNINEYWKYEEQAWNNYKEMAEEIVSNDDKMTIERLKAWQHQVSVNVSFFNIIQKDLSSYQANCCQ